MSGEEVTRSALELARSQSNNYKPIDQPEVPKKKKKNKVLEPQGSPTNPTIETVSGRYINVLSPNIEDISIEDIAWAISRISRFAGHTVTKQPYTVGQHCVFVSDMILHDNSFNYVKEERVLVEESMFALLHDAAEAFIGDIPSPVKHIPGIREKIDEIENNLLKVIFDNFVGRQPSTGEWDRVKYYDKRAQFIEANAFMVSRGRGWHDRGRYDISLLEMQEFPEPQPSVKVYTEFMDQYKMLVEEMRGISGAFS